ncbi:MarR family transcriptional regulator [Sphingomonas sp. RS2018]
MTLARATVLYWIGALDGTVTQRALADVVGIEGPTLVRQLHALEAAGLVERVAVEGDRRAKGLRLTDAAVTMLKSVNRVVDGMCVEFLDGLDRRRLSSATKLVRDAREALE